jgi:hypothetical protein
MKKILTTIALIGFLYVSSYAQSQHSMLNNPSWTVRLTFMGGESNYIGIIKQGDTTIDGKQYVVIFDSIALHSEQIKILREDTITNKVYIRQNEQDIVLFDFSLQVSDKIVLNNGQEYTVAYIDSVNVRNGKRKRLHLSHPTNAVETWIEGVGNREHPLIQAKQISTTVTLFCSFQDGVNIYNLGLANGQDTSACKPYTTNISTKKMSPVHSFHFYPNPATHTLHIDFATTIPSKIEILDLQGRTLYTQSVSSSQTTHEISLSGFSTGVYFVKLYSDEGVVLKKFIKN